MKYYIGEYSNLHIIQSFNDKRDETVTLEVVYELKHKSNLIGYDWYTSNELMSRYSSLYISKDSLDLHYLKNAILNCTLDLSHKLKQKFNIDIVCDTVSKTLSHVTYKLSLGNTEDVKSVSTFLNGIGLVNYDLLLYMTMPNKKKVAYLRIMLSDKYIDSILAKAVKHMLESCGTAKQYSLSESYSGLVLNLDLLNSEEHWKLLDERYEVVDPKLKTENLLLRFYE